MRLEVYQWQVIAGSLFAVLLAFLRHVEQHPASLGLFQALEGASFLLCVVGMGTGSRAIRARFEALGNNKEAALKDAGYLKQRSGVQLAAALAVASIWSLFAGRNGIEPWTGAPVFFGILVLLPIVNRVTGWAPN